uniref:Uncharacterized protein n=1 Tax=Parascaris univalens TaxID=6257 RepID=A0A914ZY22_PARUN
MDDEEINKLLESIEYTDKDALIWIGAYVTTAVVIASAAYLLDEHTYRNRIEVTPVSVDPRGYSANELHLLSVSNDEDGYLHNIRQTVIGATKVLNIKDIFSDENIREEAPEPVIQIVPREGKLRVTAIHHYIDMTISMPKEVTAVGSLPNVGISEDAKGKGGEIDDPIKLTHRAETVDNPSSNDDSSKKKTNVQLPCNSRPRVAEAQQTYQWQHSLHRSSSRKKLSVQNAINRRKSEAISAPSLLPPVPKGYQRVSRLHVGTTNDSSLASLRKLAMENTQQDYAEQPPLVAVSTTRTTQKSISEMEDDGKKHSQSAV